MTLTIDRSDLRRWILSAACIPLLLLAGCPQQQTSAAPGKVSSQATAPPVTTAGAAAKAAGPALPSAQEVAANNQKAQQLINRAERAYASGVKNYGSGNLDAARIDFDSAVDLMLTSGMDLKGDPQLADEFDHLLSAINSLEMGALKQGNGFSPKLEAAPLEAADDITFPANPELVAKLRTELNVTSDLPLVINDQVAGYIGVFSNSSSFKAHMIRSLERAGRYKTMIQKVLAEEGVPQDMIYLAVAESGFQPQALNGRSGAGGMWQFMPTGAYGLARNGWVDERFDPEKSSRAYARYIKGLYNQMGDWYLAMAAYDWGPGNVQRAVMRTGYADFWELYRRNAMPAETRNYVPQILAAIIMAKNPEKYGLDKMVPDPPLLSEKINVGYPIDLRLVADVTNSTVPEIVALNPSLLRMTTPRDMAFDLHLPPGTSGLFATRIKPIPEDKRTSWRFHEVRSGESLESIASTMHARLADITLSNGLSAGESVETGDELVIPIVSVLQAAAHPQRYTARRGDTLVTVADRFNVSVEELRRWNHLSSSKLAKGKSLNVAEPIHLAPAGYARGKGHGSRGRAHSHGGGSRQKNASSTRRASSRGKTSTPARHAPAKARSIAPKSKHKAAR